MDDKTRQVWQQMGFHNALREVDATDALTPDERAAMPLYQTWQRMGFQHLTISDAVLEMQRRNDKDGDK